MTWWYLLRRCVLRDLGARAKAVCAVCDLVARTKAVCAVCDLSVCCV